MNSSIGALIPLWIIGMPVVWALIDLVRTPTPAPRMTLPLSSMSR